MPALIYQHPDDLEPTVLPFRLHQYQPTFSVDRTDQRSLSGRTESIVWRQERQDDITSCVVPVADESAWERFALWALAGHGFHFDRHDLYDPVYPDGFDGIAPVRLEGTSWRPQRLAGNRHLRINLQLRYE